MIWDINPVAITLFGWPIYWYGLTYVIGFLLIDWCAPKISTRLHKTQERINKKQWSDITFGAFLWGVISGRIGDFIFYRPLEIWQNPLEILHVWNGGMSIHGGLIGAILFLTWYARRHTVSRWHITDSVVIPFAVVLGLGRIANYVNGELVGIPTKTDWGIIFPHIDNALRHPTQLYESASMFLLAGILFAVFKMCKNKKTKGLLSGVFVIGYGIFRFIIEFWKEYDPVLSWLKMGQILCLIMIGLGIWVLTTSSYSNKN